MKSGSTAKASLRERLAEEFREFAIVAVYLYVYFAALTYMKAAILQAHDIPFAAFGFAAAKALIFAKFMLMGRILGLGERFKGAALIWPTLHRTFAYFVLLFILNALEEVVVGFFHHRGVVESVSDIGGGTLGQLIASSFIGLLILFPFFAFRAIGDVVGERILVRLFFEPRQRAHDNGQQKRRSASDKILRPVA
ncbi:MAG TPA: hypothetical protein VEK55_13700 [Xanthobacteraceae bacterium]|nr:hypothetical protein [Xanthobacteraceae bacterium]